MKVLGNKVFKLDALISWMCRLARGRLNRGGLKRDERAATHRLLDDLHLLYVRLRAAEIEHGDRVWS